MLQLGRCLAIGGEGLTQIACRFLSLWFDHNVEYPEVTAIVKEAGWVPLRTLTGLRYSV